MSFFINRWFSKKKVEDVRRIVIILGMHRSGTSCLTGMLEQCGLRLGKVSRKDDFNRKGNRENDEIVSVNEDLLTLNGGAWFDPREDAVIDKKLKQRLEKVKKKISGQGPYIGIKDPRMLFCLDHWRTPNISLLGIFRHPASVSASLMYREKSNRAVNFFRAEDWEGLWYRYNLRLLSLYQKSPFPILNFDWDEERFKKAVKNIVKLFELPDFKGDFFEGSLRHHVPSDAIRSKEHARLYGELTRIAELEEDKLNRLAPTGL